MEITIRWQGYRIRSKISPSYRNISTTIFTLLRMPSAVDNPIIYAEELPSFDDSLKAKLLIAAMLDRTLAHDSPEQDKSEAAGGVHTNYIQFMDKVVKEWSGELKEHTGLEKLVQINRKPLEINAGDEGVPVR